MVNGKLRIGEPILKEENNLINMERLFGIYPYPSGQAGFSFLMRLYSHIIVIRQLTDASI